MDNINKIERLQRQKALLAKANNTLAELLLKCNPSTRVPRSDSTQKLLLLSEDCSQQLKFFQRLIESYQDHILNQENCIKELSDSLRKMKVQITAVTAQNHHIQLALRETMRLEGNSNGLSSIRQGFDKLRLQQQLEKNKFLQEQTRLLDKKLYQIKEQIIEKDNLINERSKLYNELYVKLEEAQSKFTHQQIEINQLKGLCRVQEAKINAEKKRTQHFQKRGQQLEVQLSKTKSTLDILSAKLENLKSSSSQSQAVAKHELSSAKREIELLRGRQKQIILKLTSLEKQNDQFKQQIRSLRSINQNLKLQHTELLRMTENYENKVLSAKRREDELAQQLRDIKEQLALVLTERDNLDFKTQEQVRRMERMAKQHRDQLARAKTIKT